MNKFLVLLLILPSCKMVEKFGAVSLGTYNTLIDEMNDFRKDAL